MVFATIIWPRAAPSPTHTGAAPLLLDLVELPEPQPPGPPIATDVSAGSPQNTAPPTPPRLAAPAPERVAATTPMPDTSDLLNDSQIAAATNAGEGRAGGDASTGGGGCDMALIVQQALQRDPLVRTALENADRLGKAVMLWNGDWVRSGEQDGKGLAVVRQAVTWELAFAPEACRNKRMHGLVLLSLADGTTRFAIGSGDWRWSDLLGLRKTPLNR